MGTLRKATPQEQIDVWTAERQSALGVLYSRYWAELCRYVKKTFGSGPPDPQDIVQQTFLHFASSPSTREIRNVRAYLYRTAHNILIEEHRRASVRHAATVEMVSRQGSCVEELTPERVMIADERLDIMRAVISKQSEARRRSFLLHRLEGLSCAEIARRTRYSESAIKKHIMLVMNDLEAAMARREAADPRLCIHGETDERDAISE